LRITKLFATVAMTLLPFTAQADYVDTTWVVIGFKGEAWYANTSAVSGSSQRFYKGEAAGVFYQCDYAGQSSTYTTYTVNEFLANKEFELLKPAEAILRKSGKNIYVHRITCNGNDNPLKRKVLYPFITTDDRYNAYYIYEGGYFSLINKLGPQKK